MPRSNSRAAKYGSPPQNHAYPITTHHGTVRPYAWNAPSDWCGGYQNKTRLSSTGSHATDSAPPSSISGSAGPRRRSADSAHHNSIPTVSANIRTV